VPIGPDQTASVFLCGIVPVDQSDFVAMSHRTEREKELGAKDGRYTDQHQVCTRIRVCPQFGQDSITLAGKWAGCQ
jgi:hypothetical protein